MMVSACPLPAAGAVPDGPGLKIAMLSVHSCPLGRLGGRDTGGMQVYVRELARALGRRGHLVDIYTRDHEGGHSRLKEIADNVRLVHLNDGGGETPKEALYAYMEDFTCGMEDFRKTQGYAYDLVHSHYWISGLAGTRLQEGWRVPHAVMFHTLGAVKNSLGIGGEESDLRIETERLVAAACDCIIAATPRERDELEGRYGADPDRVSIIPCGVDLELFRPADREAARRKLGLGRRPVVLFVGRIDPVKGLDLLLRALPRVEAPEPPLLLIVGGDEHSSTDVGGLRDIARQVGVEDRVRFHGLVPQGRLPAYYAAADVCAISSHYESFGMVALEALACGTPVAARDVGGVRGIITGDAMGRVVEGDSAEALAEALGAVLRQGRRPGSEETLHDAVSGYGWDRICERVEEVYRGLLGPGRRESSRRPAMASLSL